MVASKAEFVELYGSGKINDLAVFQIYKASDNEYAKALSDLSELSGNKMFRANYSLQEKEILTIVYTDGDYVGLYVGNGCNSVILKYSQLSRL